MFSLFFKKKRQDEEMEQRIYDQVSTKLLSEQNKLLKSELKTQRKLNTFLIKQETMNKDIQEIKSQLQEIKSISQTESKIPFYKEIQRIDLELQFIRNEMEQFDDDYVLQVQNSDQSEDESEFNDIEEITDEYQHTSESI